MVKRVQSPSSINTFKQCKRKYYYSYIEELPRKENIHGVRGNIAHSVLENFYTIDLKDFTKENYRQMFRVTLQNLFIQEWGKEREKLLALKLTKEELEHYFNDTLFMILNWCDDFLKHFESKLDNSIEEAFKQLTPQTELAFVSEEYKVRGFVDAIHLVEGDVHIVDYKTNKKAELKDSIKLQLAIYCLMYEEKFGKRPKKAGAFFLRDTLHMIDVDEELLTKAKMEIKNIHDYTEKASSVHDYERTVTPLCKWRTGQCDFYEVCKPRG